MISRRPIARSVAVIAGGLGLLACGGTQSQPPERPTEVTIAVRPKGPGGPVERRHVSCPANVASPVCRRLRATARGAFAPVPPDAICTAVYGGPATATVEGRLRGRELEERFHLRNGCEIARWKQFAWLLGDPPGDRRPADSAVEPVPDVGHDELAVSWSSAAAPAHPVEIDDGSKRCSR